MGASVQEIIGQSAAGLVFVGGVRYERSPEVCGFLHETTYNGEWVMSEKLPDRIGVTAQMIDAASMAIRPQIRDVLKALGLEDAPEQEKFIRSIAEAALVGAMEM